MLPTDVFRARFDQTTASLRAWTGFVADVARIEMAEDADVWRLSLEPKLAQACALELVLRRDQMMDVALGPETAEDVAITDLALPLQLAQAVADGRVITRRGYSRTTGIPLSIETRALLPDGALWRFGRHLGLAGPRDPEDTIFIDHHYLSYRR